jgi:hypothetical protein
MNIETIRKLTLARHLYELGFTNSRSANDMHLFSAINLFQDAVEVFLIAVANHVGAVLDEKTTFDKYFVQINDKIKPSILPFKNKLIQLNKLRVNSKHYGIQPARDECNRLAPTIREFFDEVSISVLGVTFATVSTIDLLEDGETKDVLLDAKNALEAKEFDICSICCRKALFLEIERHYDISEYKNETPPVGLLAGYTKAPYYSRNSQYIEKNVADPTDFIVYDHSSINEKLLINGVDNTTYWNIWRLTPEVYKTKKGKWVIKRDFSKLNVDLLSDKIEYIFSATLDVVLSIHRTKQTIRQRDYGKYYLNIKQENIPIYKKADKNSEEIGRTLLSITQIDTDYSIDGLNDDGTYWKIYYLEEDMYLIGFIHDDYVLD